MRCKFFLIAIFIALLCYAPTMADDNTLQNNENNANFIDTEMGQATQEQLDLAEQAELDPEYFGIQNLLDELEWDAEDGTHRGEFVKTLKEYKTLLDENMDELRKNVQNVSDNEQSLRNRLLGAIGVATVGIGGMMAASAFSEQRADKAAEQDMAAYIKTFRCEYAKGKTVKAGPDEIELPGGNDSKIMELRNEYFALAKDLKERKDALGMKPGIESEEIIDKAQTGLYDDESKGIDSGTYASLYRAYMGNETDKEQLKEQKESTDKKLKTGATVAAAGAVATAAANMALNGGKKDKGEELLAKRAQIKEDFLEMISYEIMECNIAIEEAKEEAATADLTNKSQEELDYIAKVKALQPIPTDQSDLSFLKDHLVCH